MRLAGEMDVNQADCVGSVEKGCGGKSEGMGCREVEGT